MVCLCLLKAGKSLWVYHKLCGQHTPPTIIPIPQLKQGSKDNNHRIYTEPNKQWFDLFFLFLIFIKNVWELSLCGLPLLHGDWSQKQQIMGLRDYRFHSQPLLA